MIDPKKEHILQFKVMHLRLQICRRIWVRTQLLHLSPQWPEKRDREAQALWAGPVSTPGVTTHIQVLSVCRQPRGHGQARKSQPLNPKGLDLVLTPILQRTPMEGECRAQALLPPRPTLLVPRLRSVLVPCVPAAHPRTRFRELRREQRCSGSLQ